MPQNIRFTTRRLFLVSAGFALAAATFPAGRDSGGLDWSAFLVSLLSFIAVFGLCEQISDLRQLLRERVLDCDERFAVRLAVFWRAALLSALAGCYTLELLISRGIVPAELRGADSLEHDRGYYAVLFPDIAWPLFVFLVLATLPQALPARRGKFLLPRMRRYAAWVLAFALAVASLGGTTIIYMLVHIATAGIEAHQPLQFQRRGTFPEHAREGFAFFGTACVSMAIVGVGAIALAGFARAACTASRWRYPALTVLVATLCATTGYAIWYNYRELPRVSADLATTNLPLNWVGGLFVTSAVMTAAFVVSLRLVRGTREADRSLPWRRVNGYFHESRATPLLAVGLAVYELAFLQNAMGRYILQDTFDVILEVVQFGSASGLVRMVGTAFHWPPTYLWLALLWMGLRLLFRRRNAEPAADDLPLQPIPPGGFLTLLLLTAWLIAAGLFTLTAFVFAMWFGPWFR